MADSLPDLEPAAPSRQHLEICRLVGQLENVLDELELGSLLAASDPRPPAAAVLRYREVRAQIDRYFQR